MSTTTRISALFSLQATPSPKLQAAVNKKQAIHITKLQILSISTTNTPPPSPKLFVSSSSSSPAVEEVKDQEEQGLDSSPSSPNNNNDEVLLQSESSILDPVPSVRGCQACGKEEIERGCDGEGRIQGGIATVPGFGWWPIKAYRPCPSYLAAGRRYKRSGQSLDDIGFGAAVRPPISSAKNEKDAQSSTKKRGARKFKS